MLRELQLDWPGPLEDLRDGIARCKDRLISPAEASRDARRGPRHEREARRQLAVAYAHYQEALGRAGWCDFGDLLAVVVQGLRDHPDLRAAYATRFQHLLVDEFQDLNPAQDALLRLLLNPQTNLWVVGDDDQAIYGWRGSDVGYIARFATTYPGAQVYRLEQNYRSPPVVLDLANRLIRHNHKRLEKTLVPTRPAVTQVVLCRAVDEHREAGWVVRALQVLLARGMARRAVAILVRAHFQTLPFEAALHSAGVPFVIRGGKGFWELKEVQAILEALWHGAGFPPGAPCPWTGLAYLQPRLAEVAAAHRERPFPALVAALAEAVAAAAPASAAEERALQWVGAAQQVAAEAREFTAVGAFLDHVRGATAGPRDDEGADTVVLSTIHQAKGLEWDAVFVCGCEAGLLPHDKAEDREEERRLAFVAATRARRYLSLSCCETRADRPVAPSPFLAEMTRGAPPEATSWRQWPPVEGAEPCWLEEPRAAPAEPAPAQRQRRATRQSTGTTAPGKGARVFHSAFGQGVVRRVCGDKWTVQFAKHGEKTILASYLQVLK